jgi:hypothetical protein
MLDLRVAAFEGPENRTESLGEAEWRREDGKPGGLDPRA